MRLWLKLAVDPVHRTSVARNYCSLSIISVERTVLRVSVERAVLRVSVERAVLRISVERTVSSVIIEE